jgi:hypothetical protein
MSSSKHAGVSRRVKVSVMESRRDSVKARTRIDTPQSIAKSRQRIQEDRKEKLRSASGSVRAAFRNLNESIPAAPEMSDKDVDINSMGANDFIMSEGGEWIDEMGNRQGDEDIIDEIVNEVQHLNIHHYL